MKIKYIEKRFGAASQAIIDKANGIIAEYQRQGFDLTLRQLFYQFVARGYLPNKQSEYRRLGTIISDARLAGLVSWHAIEDRTRGMECNAHWDSPKQILESAHKSFAINKWEGQPYYPEVWVEKEALAGVVESICRTLDVPWFACRGYNSQSEAWRAAIRAKARLQDDGQDTIILHLGDHDPSGVQMTEDNENRFSIFGVPILVERLALNMDQVIKYNPPPNPVKFNDTRSDAYVEKFGEESWELDALDPKVLVGLIEDAVLRYRDEDIWEEAVAKETKMKMKLKGLIETL